MRNPRIALYVANVTRDLPGIVLTARELCRRGATCFVILYRGGQREAWALAPDFVGLPVFRPYQAEQARQFIEAGVQYGLLDTEGAVWSSMDEYRQTFWRDSRLCEAANCVCAWGRLTGHFIVSEGLFQKDQVRITGCPRFDFYNPTLAPVFGEELRPASRREGRRHVLINTNFTMSNAERGFNAARLVETYGYDAAEVEGWIRTERKALDEIVDMAARLATDLPDIDVVVRPHPEEALSTYRDKLPRRDNLYASREGSATAWILGSVAVIQRGCTTGIEAIMAGSVPLSPRWIELTKGYPLPESVSLPCESYEALRDAVRAAAEKGQDSIPEEIRQRVKTSIHHGFGPIDGQAYRRVAGAILESLRPDVTPDRKRCRQHLHGIGRPTLHWTTRIANQVRYRLGLPADFTFRRKRTIGSGGSDDGVTVTNVERQLRAIERVLASEGGAPLEVLEARDAGEYRAGRFQGRAVVIRRRARG